MYQTAPPNLGGGHILVTWVKLADDHFLGVNIVLVPERLPGNSPPVCNSFKDLRLVW